MLSTHSSRGRWWKSSWYEPWFDSDERLTNWWNSFDGILGVLSSMRFCVSLLLSCEIVSFVRFCVSPLLVCRLCWALPLLEGSAFGSSYQFAHDRCYALFAFSWGIMCFVSVVLSFCPYLWDWDFSFREILCLPFHMAFGSLEWASFSSSSVNLFIWWNCAGCCQCTHQGGDWGPMVVTCHTRF